MTAPALDDYLEKIDDIGPSVATCSLEQGSSTVPYYLRNVTAGDTILDAITQLIGKTTNVDPPGDYRLARSLPKGHGLFQYWYADAITAIRGVGSPSLGSSSANAEAECMPAFALYPNWQLDVRFTPRPYPVLEDAGIPIITSSWTTAPGDVNDNGTDVGNLIQIFKYAPEWWRFTTLEYMPQNDNVSGVQGQSIFQLGEPGGAPPYTVPHGASFQGMPRIFLPNSLVKLTWYHVPFRYITSKTSYLNRYRGRVNQRAFFEDQDGEMLFQPGELLYLGFTPKIYTSPLLQYVDIGGSSSPARFCNIEMLFLYTNRVGVNLPTASTTTALPSVNYIAAGHNLQPYFPHRKFYYTVFNDTNNATKAPYWKSFPVEVLFTDPDSDQGNGLGH